MNYSSGVDGGDGQGGLFQHVQQDTDGVEAGEDRRVVLRGAAADLQAVALALRLADLPGVDDIRHMALADAVQDLAGALADLQHRVGADAVFLQEPGRAAGRLDVEAQVVEAADQRQRFVLVPVGDGGQHRSVVLQPGTAGLQRFVQRAVQSC